MAASRQKGCRPRTQGHSKRLDRSEWYVSACHDLTTFEMVISKVTDNGTVFSIGVAGWSLGSMTLYNRQKRKVWFAEQQAHYESALQKARQAEQDGTLTADLALVLNKERAIQQAEEEQKNRKGVLTRTKEWAFGGLAKEEKPSGRATAFSSEEIKRIAEGRPALQVAQSVSEDARTRPQDSAVTKAAKDLTITTMGGPLDQMAQNASDGVSDMSKRWSNWLRRQ